ncbi:MAG: hypothetical protein Q7R90_01775 [bacterium]|nr:hypothetical protein [bacterium]
MPPKPPKPKGIVLAELRRARTWRNRCPHCDSSNTNMEMAKMSDGGTKMLVKCGSCDKFFRDYDD